MDRGHPSVGVFFEMAARRIGFCVRMKDDWWLSVREFKASGGKDAIVEFTLPRKDRYLLDDYSAMKDQTLRCRLVAVELKGGETEILCTSLVDDSIYLYEDFKELYHYRWNVEENYKLLGSRLEIKNFSGKTAHAVKQDVYAKVSMITLCAMLAFPIEERVKKESEEAKNKHPRKINGTSALGQFKDIVVKLFLRNNVGVALDAFDNIVCKTTEIIRPNLTKRHWIPIRSTSWQYLLLIYDCQRTKSFCDQGYVKLYITWAKRTSYSSDRTKGVTEQPCCTLSFPPARSKA